MHHLRMFTRALGMSLATLLCTGCSPTASQAVATSAPQAAELGGTSWQLVKFQGGDDTVVIPDDKSKYTLAFNTDGSVSVRFDCNRGRGTWKSSGANQIEFGPMALTRAMCAPGSLYDQLVKQWPYLRSYTLKDGHLFLALQADGGIFEFETIQ